MKIVYVYRDWFKRTKQWGRMLRKLGHEVSWFEARDKKIPTDMIRWADILWIYKPQFRKVLTAGQKRLVWNTGKKLVTFGGAPKVAHEKWGKVFRGFDFVFINNKANMAKIQSLSETPEIFHYIPWGYEAELYYPGSSKKDIPSSFMGKATSNQDDQRFDWISRTKKVLPFTVFGEALCKRLGCTVRPFSTHREQREVYWRTKANLGFPFTSNAFYNELYMKCRFFEVPGCGEVFLTHYADDFAEMFEPDKEVFYYNSFDELIDKAKWIINNYSKLGKVRRAAYDRAVKDHQFIFRFRDMMNIVCQ